MRAWLQNLNTMLIWQNWPQKFHHWDSSLSPEESLYSSVHYVDILLFTDKVGKLYNPTPEMVNKYIAKNITYHHKNWIGVVAHEMGHLLGAEDVSFIYILKFHPLNLHLLTFKYFIPQEDTKQKGCHKTRIE